MNDRKKFISNFEHEVDKAQGEGWNSVDLSIEVAKEILDLLKEQEKTSCNEKMLDKLFQLLADMEIDMPCEEMSGYTDYCEENCVYSCPQKECWLYFLKGEWKQNCDRNNES